ncbi:hypothetical protein [Microbispora sp. H10949]|uniref:hypothetical protein n=1 Tax=Microbispora sp. H10949 TaxID=2729111 RepID=UPI0016003D36|nr:hypothetical protein [Microbispora sp. H10949]
MDILTLTMTGAGGLGIGLVLGGLVMRPRVGPWYGSAPGGCSCHARPAAAVPSTSATVELQTVARPTLLGPAAAALGVAYVTTREGLVPVLLPSAALASADPAAPALPAADLAGGAR